MPKRLPEMGRHATSPVFQVSSKDGSPCYISGSSYVRASFGDGSPCHISECIISKHLLETDCHVTDLQEYFIIPAHFQTIINIQNQGDGLAMSHLREYFIIPARFQTIIIIQNQSEACLF